MVKSNEKQRYSCILEKKIKRIVSLGQKNKAYTVDLNGCKKLPVYCNMDGAGLGDCGGGGWTLVMKINGAKVMLMS